MDVPAPATTRDVVVLRLAEGGMGYVELIARREGRFSRFLARKRLHAHFRNDATFRAMLLDEARLAGLVRHPNVTAVLELGEDEAGPFFLMDYVEGPSVAQILERVEPRDALLPVALCVAVVAQAARGLHAAHELASSAGVALGVVHRDISPKNLLVGFDGLVRVADFGIAKAKDNLEQTRIGVLKGNVGYMSPEYLRFQELDCRSDLFALGVVLYEMLARERLYGGDDTATIARRILEEPPPDVFEVRDVPPELAALLFELLAKDRALRPPSALALATTLDAIGAGLAAVDGPFDVAQFLERELGALRREREAAIDAALAMEGERPRARASETPPIAVPTRRRRATLLGVAGLAIVVLGVVVWRAARTDGAWELKPGEARLWAGGWHNCALRNERLACWGRNDRGQLGDGSAENRAEAVFVELGPTRAAALGEYHTCALATDGRVSCWGRNVRGEIGQPEPKLVKEPRAVAGVHDVTALAAGRQHTCALARDGAVLCWGANHSAQLGRPPSANPEPPARVPDLPPVESIFAGGANTCARLRGGGLRCWGANESGQLGGGAREPSAPAVAIPGTDAVVSVALGNNAKAGSKNPDLTKINAFACGLERAGSVLCWGSNYTGQLGDGTREDRASPTRVLGVDDAVAVAAGDYHACALHRSGAISCWGRNEFGAVGDGTMGPSVVRMRAVRVAALGDGMGLALGGAHSCARRTNGAVDCWGVNNFGQVGETSLPLRPEPASIRGLP